MIALEPDFLCGSYPPLITPFRGGDVDYDSYASLIEHQIANGTHGVVVNGTTSEPTSLTVDERNRLVRTAVEVAGGRLPVVAQTGSQSHAETVALTEYAAKAGADALPGYASGQLALVTPLAQPGEQVVGPTFARRQRNAVRKSVVFACPTGVAEHLRTRKEWAVGRDLGGVGPHGSDLLRHPGGSINRHVYVDIIREHARHRTVWIEALPGLLVAGSA